MTRAASNFSSGISCRGLTCGYGDRPVFEALTLDVPPGRLVCLLGPNGAGKTTAIRAVTGEIEPVAGEVRILDRPLASLRSRELARAVAYVPQAEAPAFPYTAGEVCLMGRAPWKARHTLESEEDVAVARRALERLDLLPLADRPVTELSGGERQRVAVARALAQEAPIVVLDEPTAHLDPAHRRSMFALLRDLAAEGRAVLLATHDLDLAASFADEACLLAGGRVVAAGPPERVLTPEALRAAFDIALRITDVDGTKALLYPPVPPRAPASETHPPAP